MAHYGGQRGDSDMRRQNDEFGNTIRQTDEFGNPVQETGYGTGGYGAGTGSAAGATGGLGYGRDQQQHLREERRGGGLDSDMRLQSDDYGNTIRRDEFGNPGQQTGHGTGSYGAGAGTGSYGAGTRENIPGMGREDDKEPRAGSYPTSTAASGGYGAELGQQQEKGIMDKIMEKLPGNH